MKFRRIYILPILLIIVAGYLINHYVYPEFIVETILKEKFGKNLTLDCWGYQFMSTQTSRYTNQSLTTIQKVNFLRDSLNQNYTNFIESPNITKPDFYVMELAIRAVDTNLVESIYALLKDVIPDTSPEVCKTIRSDEEFSKVLLSSIIMTNHAILSYQFSSVSMDQIEYCHNTTDNRRCIDNYLDSFKTLAEERKNSLPSYREIKLTKCPNTLIYLQIKDLEKEIRNQLSKSKDPFSIMLKSLQIDMYDKCSRQLYDEFMSRYGCPIIPLNKVGSVEAITSTSAMLAYCSSSYLRKELTIISGQLNVTT